MDANKAMREVITTPGSVLSGLVAGRVYTPHYPLSRDGDQVIVGYDNAEPGIRFHATDGTGLRTFRADAVRFMFVCTGGKNADGVRTAQDAYSVWDALRELFRAVNNRPVAEATIAWVALESGPQYVEDPDTGWPTWVGAFRAMVYTT